jgi:dolichol-phosphate mannosyltransferase
LDVLESRISEKAGVIPFASPSWQLPAELTIVIPTLNEQDNITPLLECIADALQGIAWEVIFVDDDSADETMSRVRQASSRDARVRGLHRIGRRGLSSACIEGILASAAPYVAVMDADLQHDETLLPRMLKIIQDEELDIVVASRYVAGGTVGDWDSRRVGLSSVATWLGRLVINVDLKDPMSGYFLVRRTAFDQVVRRLSGQGFKILLDIFASSRTPLRFRELPFQFRDRVHGSSKLDFLVAWEYLMLVADKLFGRYVPVRFLMFAVVGSLGLVVHLVTLSLSLNLMRLGFVTAQATATSVAMLFNFAANNVLTYRDQRLRGWRFVRGLLSFVAICSVGAVANVGAASLVYGSHQPWWLAGVAGALVGAVWNYAVSSVVTWRKAL